MARSHQYRSGLIHYEPSLSHRGYTLFCAGTPASAYLIDMHGRICHRWTNARGIAYASLLPNGHVLCRASPSPEVQGLRGLNGQAPSVFELNWHGELVWSFDDEWLHHDQERLPNGNTLLLAWRWLSEAHTATVKGGMTNPDDPAQMLADVIIEVDDKGDVVTQWNSWDHLDVDADVICPIDHRLEWTHANSISTTLDGDWLVSLRRIDTIAAINPEDGSFRWKWGRGTLAHQHDAKMLANGNVLLFDNGVHRPGAPEFSRVLEVDTAVTPDNNIVWEYVNPFYAHNPRLGGKMNIVFRAHRHGPDDPALLDRDLDPRQYQNLNRLFGDS
jgi:hypothetical protein